MDPKDRLPAEFPPLEAEEILRRLTAGGVDFVVIGGIALVLLGSPRMTRDLDIVFAPDDANLDALGRVLIVRARRPATCSSAGTAATSAAASSLGAATVPLMPIVPPAARTVTSRTGAAGSAASIRLHARGQRAD